MDIISKKRPVSKIPPVTSPETSPHRGHPHPACAAAPGKGVGSWIAPPAEP